MNATDKNKLRKLWEQVHNNKDIIDMSDRIIVHSVDGTGTIGIDGKIDSDNFTWVEPMQVYGVEEAHGSKQKYSAKTQQLLDIFAPDTLDFKKLQQTALQAAKEMEYYKDFDDNDNDYEYYYNFKKRNFVLVNSYNDDAKFFRVIAKILKNS